MQHNTIKEYNYNPVSSVSPAWVFFEASPWDICHLTSCQLFYVLHPCFKGIFRLFTFRLFFIIIIYYIFELISTYCRHVSLLQVCVGGLEITPPVIFRLRSGAGPVHISGQHLVSEYLFCLNVTTWFYFQNDLTKCHWIQLFAVICCCSLAGFKCPVQLWNLIDYCTGKKKKSHPRFFLSPVMPSFDDDEMGEEEEDEEAITTLKRMAPAGMRALVCLFWRDSM